MRVWFTFTFYGLRERLNNLIRRIYCTFFITFFSRDNCIYLFWSDTVVHYLFSLRCCTCFVIYYSVSSGLNLVTMIPVDTPLSAVVKCLSFLGVCVKMWFFFYSRGLQRFMCCSCRFSCWIHFACLEGWNFLLGFIHAR